MSSAAWKWAWVLLLTVFFVWTGSVLYSADVFDNGERFVLGIYAVDQRAKKPGDRVFDNDTVFGMLKNSGFEYIHDYGIWENPEEILDLAQKHGLKVMFDVHSSGFQEEPQWLEKIMTLVKRVKDHPALGFWYIWDEPATSNLPRVDVVNKAIKALSSHPTALVIHERKNYWDSRGHSDIWMADNYPVRGEIFPSAPLQWNSRMMRNAASGYCYKGVPFIAVLQACDFRCFKTLIDIPENRQRTRFPNLTEMRFMAFGTLCFGTRGIFYFSLHHCHLEDPAGKEFFDHVLTPTVKDIRQITDMIPRIWEVTSRSSKFDQANKVSFAYWKRPHGKFVILTNDSPETRDLKLDLSPLATAPASGKLRPLLFTRKDAASWSGGKLTVKHAAPWETFLWRVETP